MQGSDCVTFIGNLVLSSFPPGYFLEKKNSFSVAISSTQMDLLFGNVFQWYFLLHYQSWQLFDLYFCYSDCFQQVPSNTEAWSFI
jgi:hypothetical protein